MKLIKIFLILSLVIFSFARISRKNEANLKSKVSTIKASKKASKKASSSLKNMGKDVLGKGYKGILYMDGADWWNFYLEANRMQYNYPQGIVFERPDDNDFTDNTLMSYLIRISSGNYYLPYIMTSEIIFTDEGCCTHDDIVTYVKSRRTKFEFVFGSWDQGSGQDLTYYINSFRSSRISYIRSELSLLSKYATDYSTASQSNASFDSSSSGIDNQISSITALITARQTLRDSDFISANSYPNQIINVQTPLAALNVQLAGLYAANIQKTSLIAQLTNAIAGFNAQNSTSADKLKIDVDANSQAFLDSLVKLKVEVVGDSDKVDAASDALIKTNDLNSCTSIMNTITP